MDIYSRVIAGGDHSQIKLTVSEFKGLEYLHIREYFLDFEGEWCPTGKGVHIPLEIDTSIELFKAVAEIISLAESKEVIEEFFAETIKEVYDG